MNKQRNVKTSNKMMNYNGFNVEIFKNSDILKGMNNIESHGYSRNMSLEEMIPIAIEYRCPVIVRGGTNAKWYLKCQGKTEGYVREKIGKCDSTKWKRRTLYFIPQVCLQEKMEEFEQEKLEERISSMRRIALLKTKIDEKKAEIVAKQLELDEMMESMLTEEVNLRKDDFMC